MEHKEYLKKVLSEGLWQKESGKEKSDSQRSDRIEKGGL
jgi:hypothetical protein